MTKLEELGYPADTTVHQDGVPFRVKSLKHEGRGRKPSLRVECLDPSVVRPLKTIGIHLIDEEQDKELRHENDEVRPAFKILVIDIETRPNLAYAWTVWDANISPGMLVEEKDVISFAAKWVGDDETVFYSVHDHTKEEMVEAAWSLLDRADAVIHYNGKKFDVPHLNTEFLRLGYGPPAPFRQIDLLNTMRREFKFSHNKLDHVSTQLGIGKKTEHEGFDLWIKCMRDDDAAWAKMREYNIQDVLLTERLYEEIKPWITNHPSFAAIFGDSRCTNCGSPRLKPNGYQHTKTGRYRRYKCEECNKSVRDTHRIAAAAVTETSTW